MCGVKIKIVRRLIEVRSEKCPDKYGHSDVYDVYHGFTGMPSTLPFCTKWVLHREGLSQKDVLKILKYWALDSTSEAILKSK